MKIGTSLGEQVLDIYLNDHVRWRGVPGAAWDYKIDGFQVLRKVAELPGQARAGP